MRAEWNDEKWKDESLRRFQVSGFGLQVSREADWNNGMMALLRCFEIERG